MITQLNHLDFSKTYSYADYVTWKIKERIELIKGKIFEMSPAPRTIHQKVLGNLHGFFWTALRNQKCQVFTAPFDVRLIDIKKVTNDEAIYTVVQPDLCVFCDESKIDERGAIGSPDLVIEILSPGNSKKELKYKYDLYQESGVSEYWIVNPTDKSILIYILENQKYIGLHPLTDEDVIKSIHFPNLEFNISEIF